MEDNVTINDNYEYNDNPNQQEYDDVSGSRMLASALACASIDPFLR